MSLICKKLAKKMKKNVGVDTKFDIKTTEVAYKNSTMRIIEPKQETGDYHIIVNGKDLILTLDDVLMMFVYFSLMYKGMDE